MQKSGVFVVFRRMSLADKPAVSADAPLPSGPAIEYFARLDVPTDETLRVVPGVGNISTSLKYAVQLDRAGAFKMAVGIGPEWGAAELVSDKNGVRIEM